MNEQPNKKAPGIFSIILSVVGALFGVQSESRRKNDFENGHAADYIAVGIIAVIIFVGSIIWYVNSVVNEYNAVG